MLIRNPINPYPQNITVDPNKVTISFTFMGDRLGSYKINIYSYSPTDPEQLVSIDKTFVVNLDEYVYNNTEISDEVHLIDVGVELGKAYTWEVVMSPYKNLGADNDLEQFNFTSPRYFFQAAAASYIVANPDDIEPSFLINSEKYDYFYSSQIPRIEVTNLQNRNLNIEGYYLNGNIKYYYFQMFDKDNNLIEETNKIFSNKIEYKFSGLLPFERYTLYFVATSQQEQYTNVTFEIMATYQTKTNIKYPPILSCNENEANIEISWIKDCTSAGNATGDYEISEGQVNIISGEIVYDNISSLPIVMDKNNFAIGIKTTISDDTTKIFDYVNNNIIYSVYMKDYKIYLQYKDLDTSLSTTQFIANFKENIIFGIQDSNETLPDTGYMWYTGLDDEGNEYEIENSESSYILVSPKEKYKYLVLLQNTNNSISCNAIRIEE